MLRYLTISFLILTTLAALGQTKITPPPAKIQFSELSSLKKNKNKEFKLQDKYKQDKIKGITKILKSHTEFDKYQIDQFTTMIKGLDSASLEDFDKNLTQIASNQDERVEQYDQKYKKTKRRKDEANVQKDKVKNIKEQKRRYKRAVRDSLGTKIDTKDILLEVGKDTLSSYASEALDYDLDFDSLSSYSLDSLLYSGNLYDSILLDTAGYLPAQSEVEKFLDAFAKKEAKRNGLFLPEDNTPTTQVKNYIPELEKFNYVKPEIPPEKLSKALIEQQKERRADELKKSITGQFDSEEEASIKQSFVQRWRIGGYIEYKANVKVLELTPTLAYGLNEKFTVGVGYSTSIPFGDENTVNRQVAYRTFLDYLFYRSFYLHIESEWKEQQREEMPAVNERSTYLGIGRNIRYKKISTSVLALYNFNAPNKIETRRFSVRFAINFHP